MKNIFSVKKKQLKHLKCPICPSLLKVVSTGLQCPVCREVYPIKKISYFNKKIYTPILNHPIIEKIEKINFKNFTDASHLLLSQEDFSCTPGAREVYMIVSALLKEEKGFIVDNGAGNNGFRYFSQREIFSIEIKKYGEPYYPLQLITDSNNLPFLDSSVDVFVSNFVVQEIKDKETFFKEMQRSLKEKGRIIISFPSPFWYFAFFLSPASYKSYIKKVKSNPKKFFRNPFHHFLHENTHGCKDYSFLREIQLFKASEYEKIFNKLGLKVVKKIQSGNIFSLYPRYSYVAGMLKNKNIKSGIHYTYVLEK
ncbi:MAG TPA: methyltransferase domain-containing protein [Candidatus Nanoarchaeia archaeon]|nr:methyltransferase domain-containing protein [Candidatus Nanoarchaeia archaeon]